METSRTNAHNTKETSDHLFVLDIMNSICPMKFFRTTDTTDTTDTTIWKPGRLYWKVFILKELSDSVLEPFSDTKKELIMKQALTLTLRTSGKDS